MNVRRAAYFSEVAPAGFSDPASGLVTNLVSERTTNVPTPKTTPKATPTALQWLVEGVPSEAEKSRLASDYSESSALFDADRSEAFAAALDAQRGTSDGGLTGWLDALDRGSQHR